MNEDRDKCMKMLVDYLDATIAFRETIHLLGGTDAMLAMQIAQQMNAMNQTIPTMLTTYIRLTLFGQNDKLCTLAEDALDTYCKAAMEQLEIARKSRGIVPN